MISRRSFMAGLAASSVSAPLLNAGYAASQKGPNWDTLADIYTYPEWFRDAKFGLWSHWGPQCVPEFGDWYGRLMYLQGTPFYEHHLKHYGHPSKRGFLEIIGDWKAENWEPETLTTLFKNAGAKYIVSMANHHDNLDSFDSAHHAWNTMNVGPKRDIVGTWERAVRAAGLKFGVSNHSGHAWHWYQVAYGYDAEGPYAGKRYDAYNLTKADGIGTWWEGLDPQELYTGRHIVVPDGITSTEVMNKWHDEHDGQWVEHGPDDGGKYVANWLARQKDLVEKYRPDLVYLDNYGLPFGKAGLEAANHYYREAIRWHGRTDVAMTAKKLTQHQRLGLMEDVERGFIDHIAEHPWQTCTCIGNWHYDRGLYERKGYKTAHMVVQRLLDVVSKNGNLLLSIPMRADGTIDSEEEKILAGLTDWINLNGDAIYGTRPWHQYGDGPTKVSAGMHGEGKASPFTAADIRFTKKGNILFAAFLDWPEGQAIIPPLGSSKIPTATVKHVSLMSGEPIAFEQTAHGLKVSLPAQRGAIGVPVLKIEGYGLT